MANDYTVKAGSWGEKTVQKIVRIQEKAARLQVPLLYLVDAAGGRISEQIKIFPGRFHAGRIFYNEVQLSGVVPQVCILFGPSPAGSAYLPALTDCVIMVDGKAWLYVGSPRMVEMAIGEKTDARGAGRRAHALHGVGLRRRARRPRTRRPSSSPSAISRYMPELVPRRGRRAVAPRRAEARPADRGDRALRPAQVLRHVRGDRPASSTRARGSRSRRCSPGEIITGFARLGGRAVGIVANQPKVKGGVLFVDSSDKAARFIWLCNAYNIPLVYLADVSGFMVGSKVERAGIIRHGAKMIFATSQATVPKICVVVRKCYGAGLYAMCGQAFEPDAVLALPQAQVAIMGPEPAVNAVYYNRIMELPRASARRVRPRAARGVPEGHRRVPARLGDARRRRRPAGRSSGTS